MKHTIRCLFVTTMLTLTAAVEAQEEVTTEESESPRFTLGGGAGLVTLGSQQWYRLNFRPEIPVGNAGVALDLELFIDNRGNFNKKGWDFSTGTTAMESLLRKIYYVRYGHPSEHLYARVGALDEVTLGYGFIMNRYRNTLDYPAIKRTGLYISAKDISSLKVGLEGVMTNFQDLKNEGALVGGRFSIHPLANALLLNRLQVGATIVYDINQFSGLQDGDEDGIPDLIDDFPEDEKRSVDSDGDGIEDADDIDDDNNNRVDTDYPKNSPLDSLTTVQIRSISNLADSTLTSRKDLFNLKTAPSDAFGMFGFDIGYPIFERERTKLVLYAQYARIIDDDDTGGKAEGFGIAGPGIAVKAGALHGKLEYRHFKDQFLPEYFDNIYDLDRARIDQKTGRATPKEATLSGLSQDVSVDGAFGEAGANFGEMIDITANYQYLTGFTNIMTGEDKTNQRLIARGELLPQVLERIPHLSKAVAYYEKDNIGTR
ncbi:MAG: hypothetical protein HY709_02300, partial [Candidatus Latescibacteria bacterium]|nr:hypothetical protein [Candidatus Latescibacterota bacterium]